jgi:peptidoglycan/xylan/chitin deacetylase (PgdA/CDA1 family)
MRPLFEALSPGGQRGRLSILIFHRVLPRADPMHDAEVTAAGFNDICVWLRNWFNVLPLEQAVAGLRARTLPSRALAITFDDGYSDNHDIAAPILRRHSLPATFFVSTGYLDGGLMWNDKVVEAVRKCQSHALDLAMLPSGLDAPLPLQSAAHRRMAAACIIDAVKYQPAVEREAYVNRLASAVGADLPTDLMMSADQVRSLARSGMTIGAHTVSHPILAGLADEGIRREVADGRRDLEEITNRPVTLFAYPNGKPGVDYDERAVEIVRSLGFVGAVTTQWGACRADTEPMELPRFTPWDRTRARFGLRLAANLWR